MKVISPTLVRTWLFLIKSKDPKLAKQRFFAVQKIRALFGNTDVAELYIEQEKDHDIEVMLI